MDAPPTAIATERLVLRRWEDHDVDALGRAITASLEHLRPWMAWVADEPLDRAARLDVLHRFKTSWQAGDSFAFGVFLDDSVVGGMGLHRRVGPGGLEIGYWVHVAHVGVGIATEAAGALARVALGIDGVERVEIHHDLANRASGRVPAKLGFTVIDEREVPPTAPGETGRRLVWGLRSVENLTAPGTS